MKLGRRNQIWTFSYYLYVFKKILEVNSELLLEIFLMFRLDGGSHL